MPAIAPTGKDVNDSPRSGAKRALSFLLLGKNIGKRWGCGTLISHGFLRGVNTTITAGGNLARLPPKEGLDVALLCRPARQGARQGATFLAAIALAAETRTANVEETAARFALTANQQDVD